MSKFIKRGISFILGLIILSIGISFTILAGLGTGAWDALNVGLSQQIGFTVGNWVIIIGVLLIVINAFLLKARPEVVSIITVILIGYFIDFWLLYALVNWYPEPFYYQVMVLIIGVVLMALGIAIYLQAEFAVIPIDRLMIAIRRRTGFSLMVSKTIGEVIALVFAFLVGGPIGLGTIVATFSIGPLIQVFFPRIEKLVKT
ncbi:YczE/YyaS/YitT family protein [Anaerobacillus sp. MEB173]|uniref:YczE/YyaS/YitT family protein n=1 Tax=Anaerobacillus sp. MEB173 TaxID=3383345 RepID=UPI003F8FA82C